ncbi:Coq4 family protein [Erythrobacter sp. F6033]|uniref:Coq4 family protein n=1 Tax=Erythrobacter sp. F6033 TaxID=2926401 RepID=UPI001FF46D45|nr:Coq4 family protein [Erythrobacter sp. F6033]MCK0128493.1 Coq4 family protein [Erythrobacter sp. F6033]
MSTLDLPLVANDRDRSGFRPLKALHHFRNLIANKEDTKEVFFIIDALKGKAVQKQAEAFVQSKTARRFIQNEDNLAIADMLDDHDRWADCGPNTVAQHYIRFMKREQLTANGLVDESYDWRPRDERPADQVEWYFNRLRDTHDLFHVLTTYGRDALGEAALLGFSYEQNHNLGVKFIAYAAARQIKKVTGTSAPLYAAIKEGRALGKAADKLAHMDVDAVMRDDIEAVRARLKIGEPVVYRECLRILDSEGHSANDVNLSQSEAQPCCDGGAQAA